MRGKDLYYIAGIPAGWENKPIKKMVYYIDDYNGIEKVRAADAIYMLLYRKQDAPTTPMRIMYLRTTYIIL